MKDLVKIDGKTCLSCKYHVGFGAQPGSQCRDNTKNFKNVCCNYLRITGKSRIFVNGEKAYDPKFCDKYEAGPEIVVEQEPTFPIHSARYRKGSWGYAVSEWD